VRSIVVAAVLLSSISAGAYNAGPHDYVTANRRFMRSRGATLKFGYKECPRK
jgi:hypothetical protein